MVRDECHHAVSVEYVLAVFRAARPNNVIAFLVGLPAYGAFNAIFFVLAVGKDKPFWVFLRNQIVAGDGLVRK